MISSLPSPTTVRRVYERMGPTDPFIVIAGHYSLADYLSEVSNEGAAEAASFALGTGIVARALARKRSARLVLLINDIGLDTRERSRLKTEYRIPANYVEILESAGVDKGKLSIVFESTMRNKASTSVRKLYKRSPFLFEKMDADEAGLVRCVENIRCEIGQKSSRTAYIIKGPDEEKLVVKEGPNPKCNLILATFFDEMDRRYGPGVIINIFNEVYRRRLRLGIHVCQKLFNNMTLFRNIYCDGSQISHETNGPCYRDAG